MPKKYRHILAAVTVIGAIAAVWFWFFTRSVTTFACVLELLAGAGIAAASLLWRAYINYETWRCGRK